MIINKLTAFVFDIEVFPNLFTCAVKNSESQAIRVYEISERQNDIADIVKLFSNKNIIFVSYNGTHYDNPIISYIIMNYDDLIYKPVWEITSELKKFSDLIINNQENQASWRKYKFSGLIKGLDLLTLMFSSKLRVGLKELQVTMEYENVQEYEGDFSRFAPLEDFDKVIQYNINDVNSTEALLNRLSKDIQLRLNIQEEFGINVLNMDGVSIGKEILKTFYLRDANKTWNEIKDLRSPCEFIPLKDIIIPTISYETDQLKDLLERMKKITLNPGVSKWNETFNFFGTIVNIAEGGVHSVNKPEIIIPKEDEILMDWDAASLYPSLLIEWGFYPQHLGKEFLQTYSNIRKERIEAKHNGNKTKNETLKLALNSVTGLMQSEYSWMYSPKDVYKIRMNGQLLLLKLAEMLILATNCRIIQYNTDGIFVLIKKDQLEKANEVIKEFESFSRLSMEGEEFEAFFQYAVNDYIAVHKGYAETKNPDLIKTKGLFINKVILGKGMAPQIIAETLIQYFVNNVPVNTTLNSCTDIKKFLTYQKVNKDFTVMYGNKKMPHINRYYMSINGYKLSKCKIDSEGRKSQMTDICASSGVTIVNDLKAFEEIPFEKAKINYQYYRGEIYKVIYPLEDSLNPTLF